ncbi:MAG: hypothetical protein WBV69_20455 [Candidatus Sulfotelmatobacter sp.]
MNTKHVDAIAKAVLYEGYMLYPYRPSSVKNRQRFNFGVLYQKSYSEAQSGSDAWSMQTECLVQEDSVQGDPAQGDPLQEFVTVIEVKLRFLKLVDRSVHQLSRQALEHFPADSNRFDSVPMITTDDRAIAPWQEAIECEVNLPPCKLDGIAASPLEWKFSFPAKQGTEPLCDESGRLIGSIERRQDLVEGVVEAQAVAVGERLFKVQIRVKNLTSVDKDNGQITREAALMRSLVSAHVLLGVNGGQFVSLLEPPENLREMAGDCRNIGVWPVLVGNEGSHDTMLASPIILYDYPQIAPESPGDLFDGTEIDEILALRILTMTDEEKQEMRQSDERARKMLERTESLPMEYVMKLHGTLRELRPSKEEMP